MYIVVTILVAITALIATNFSIVHNDVKFELLSTTQFQNADKTEIKQALLAGDIVLVENSNKNIVADQLQLWGDQLINVPIVGNDINGKLKKERINYGDVAESIVRATSSSLNVFNSVFYTQLALLFDDNRHLATSRLKQEMEIKSYSKDSAIPHMYMVSKSTMTTWIEELKGIYKNDKFELKHMNFASFTRKNSTVNSDLAINDGSGSISITRNISSEINGKLTFSENPSGELGMSVTHSESVTSGYGVMTTNNVGFQAGSGYDYFSNEIYGDAYQSKPFNVIENKTYETKMVRDIIFDMTATCNQDYVYSGTSLTQINLDGKGFAPNYINDQFSGIFIMAGFRPKTNKRFFVSNIITDTSGDDKLNWGTSDKSSGFSESPMFYYEEG